VLLAELPLRAIPATPNLYLDEGQRVTATFQVYDRGRPATSSVPFNLSQNTASGGAPDNTVQAQTDANGFFELPLGRDHRLCAVVHPAGKSRGAEWPPNADQYLYVRPDAARRHANRRASADLGNVYANVLANWNALAPCMDNWLRLDDPEQVKAYAALLKLLTNPANFEHFRFMPVTRDMTAGERTLLYKFSRRGRCRDGGRAGHAADPQFHRIEPGDAARRNNLTRAVRRDEAQVPGTTRCRHKVSTKAATASSASEGACAATNRASSRQMPAIR